jgi:hypothetical protein
MASIAQKTPPAPLFIIYHVEPWRRYDLEKAKGDLRIPIYKQPLENHRSVLQIAELKLQNGMIVCNRNEIVILPATKP